MKRLIFCLIGLVLFAGTSHAWWNRTVYHIGSSSGVAISSVAFTNAYAIRTSTLASGLAVSINDVKISADENTTIEVAIALSTHVTGGYAVTIANTKPLSPATANTFTAFADVTVSTAALGVGTVFRVPANHLLQLSETGGQIIVPKGYALIVRAMADSAGKNLFGLFRVWE